MKRTDAIGTTVPSHPYFSKTPILRSHRHHRRTTTTTTTKTLFLLSLLLLAIYSLSNHLVEGKEIIATREWQELEEGDSVPAGLHIRMDMTTGKKWARLDIDDGEEVKEPEEIAADSTTAMATVDSLGNNAVSILPESSSSTTTPELETTITKTSTSTTTTYTDPKTNKSLKITHIPDPTVTPEISAKIRDQISAQERQKRLHESIAALDDHPNADPSSGDSSTDGVEMMYRALSGLPGDEIGRMGGLPVHPGNITTVGEREEFERVVRERWAFRQAVLKEMEEEYMADAPDLLRDRIKSMERYLESPSEGLKRLLDGSAEGVDDIVWVLDDLEYQLMDIDMARDFHTMGGWPALASLITDSVHAIETSTDEYTRQLVWKIQGLASSTIGSAVRNVEEFHPWALETFDVGGTDEKKKTNVLSVLVHDLESYATSSQPWQEDDALIKKIYKQLNALGALLRGNTPAVAYFTSFSETETRRPRKGGGGAQSLSGIATSLLRHHRHRAPTSTATTKVPLGVYTERLLLRIVSLAHDILTETLTSDTETRSAFTTVEWCTVPKSAMEGGGLVGRSRTKEGVLDAAVVMAKECGYRKSDFDGVGVVDRDGEEGEVMEAWERLWGVIV